MFWHFDILQLHCFYPVTFPVKSSPRIGYHYAILLLETMQYCSHTSCIASNSTQFSSSSSFLLPSFLQLLRMWIFYSYQTNIFDALAHSFLEIFAKLLFWKVCPHLLQQFITIFLNLTCLSLKWHLPWPSFLIFKIFYFLAVITWLQGFIIIIINLIMYQTLMHTF